ncbi:glycosyltransferase family 2 protein [Azotobacter salinestris]|uniref:glycosyltransferase family 2 protein n=1 Tax=Azotobacter salinestris TaxID=69964 RepID=UPI0012668E96|nr:glycosyltransferase family 2 protein [Azotobacter salinestris]
MKNAIAVSVIVPTYNAERYIQRALDSLASQSLENIEIIVVDDASTDKSSQIINLKEKSLNLIYLRQPVNQGTHNARLLGLQHASGAWIGFLDSDDTVHPDMFGSMHEVANKHQADIVICGSYRVAESGERLGTKISFPENTEINADVFRKFCRFEFGTGMLCNKLYRKEIILPLKKMYFPWRQNLNEDLLLNIGCFSKASTVYLMKDILYDYTHNQASTTSILSRPKAYVETYRAYAIAASKYSELGASALENITEMYRTQLRWGNYNIDNLEDLSEYREELQQATNMLYQHYPHGLALLAARPERKPPVEQPIMKQITRKLVKTLQSMELLRAPR